jgi:hypothetical protein
MPIQFSYIHKQLPQSEITHNTMCMHTLQADPKNFELETQCT